jgi:fumarate reductase subunit C
MMKTATRSAPPYTRHHPRWYHPRVSTYWWLGSWPYSKFIIRELTSVAVAWTVALTLLQLYFLAQGAPSYAQYQDWLRSPVIVTVNVVAFFMLLFHSITWFNLAPHALGLRLRGQRVPDIVIAGPNYVAWIAVSVLVAWMVLGR